MYHTRNDNGYSILSNSKALSARLLNLKWITHTITRFIIQLQPPDSVSLPFLPLHVRLGHAAWLKPMDWFWSVNPWQGLEEGAACHVKPVVRSVGSMKGSWNNEKALSLWRGCSSTTHTLLEQITVRRWNCIVWPTSFRAWVIYKKKWKRRGNDISSPGKTV